MIAIVTALACCNACSGGIAIAATIEEYGQQITENTSQIEQLEIIKEQLHITAELLRANDYINNGFGEQLSQKWHECTEWQESKRLENIELKTLINDLREAQTKEYVGGFKITHYCPCLICNGNYGNQTALGTPLTPYKTIAVDPSICQNTFLGTLTANVPQSETFRAVNLTSNMDYIKTILERPRRVYRF